MWILMQGKANEKAINCFRCSHFVISVILASGTAWADYKQAVALYNGDSTTRPFRN